MDAGRAVEKIQIFIIKKTQQTRCRRIFPHPHENTAILKLNVIRRNGLILRSVIEHGRSLSSTLFTNVMEVLARAIRQTNKIKYKIK